MTISQVSNEVGVSADTLRYYEKMGLIPNVERKNGNIRNYSDSNLQWIKFVLCMKRTGLSIEELIKYVNLYDEERDTSVERKMILLKQRESINEKITELESVVDYLDYKLELIK